MRGSPSIDNGEIPHCKGNSLSPTCRFVAESHPDSEKIKNKSKELDECCQRLTSLAATRLSKLQVSMRKDV